MSPDSNDSTLVGRCFFLYLLFSTRPSCAPTTRSVMPRPAAARAQRRKAAAPGSPRRGTANCTATSLLVRALLVGIDDARDQRMAHHVLRAELREGDAAHVVQDAPRLDEAALLPAREVDLRHVAVHHRPRAEADARQEHLHLLGRGVLRLVEDDEGV